MSELRRRAALVVASLVVAFVVAEMAFRIWVFWLADDYHRLKYSRLDDIPETEMRYRADPHTAYALNPAYRGVGGDNRHNTLGMRGDEIAFAKPDGVFRIACIGASTTYTSSVNDYRKSWPRSMQEILREKYGHANVEVINAGVPGYTSWEVLGHLQFRVLPLEPDLVMIHLAANDVKPRLVPPELYFADASAYRKAWPQGGPWWDRSMVLRYLGVQIGFSPRNGLGYWVEHKYPETDEAANLRRNPPIWYRRNLEHMATLARAAGARVMFSTFSYCDELCDEDIVFRKDYVPAGVDEHNFVLEDVAKSTGAAFFDFAARMPRGREYWSDSHHVNETGAQRKAELFAEYVGEQLLGR